MTESQLIELTRIVVTAVPTFLPMVQVLLDRGADTTTAVRLALRQALESDSGPMVTAFERSYQDAIDGVDTKKLKISSVEDADKKDPK